MKQRAPLAPEYREACYWLEGVEIPRPRVAPPPPAPDVVVIGGGYTGVAAAWELARRGRSVVIVEEHTLGWGASTRNGGMVLPDVKHAGFEELRKRHGPVGPALYEATLESVRLLEQTVEGHGIDCDYTRSGHLELAHCPSALDGLRTMQRVYRDDLALEATVLDKEELREEIGSTAFPGALRVEHSGGLHPARYFAGLARLALDAGAQVMHDTRVSGVERERNRFAVRTTRGVIWTGDVLVATDGYTDAAVPELHRRVLPIGSYIIATEPLDPALAEALSPRRRMFFDTRNFLSYWRLSPDGTRMLFGGRASLAPTTVARARDTLYERMIRVHPQLAGTRVAFGWGGTVGLTRDRTPRIGRTADGLTYTLGYSGTGVAASTWYGMAAARWICGDAAPSFAGLRFPDIPLWRSKSAWLPLVGLWFRWQDRCRKGLP